MRLARLCRSRQNGGPMKAATVFSRLIAFLSVCLLETGHIVHVHNERCVLDAINNMPHQHKNTNRALSCHQVFITQLGESKAFNVNY